MPVLAGGNRCSTANSMLISRVLLVDELGALLSGRMPAE
jgi:hypothetical protein